LDHRLTKLEKEFRAITDKNFERILDVISSKIDSNLSAYLPKVQTLIYDFEDFKGEHDTEMVTIKKSRDVTVPHLVTQLDGLRKDIEAVRTSDTSGQNNQSQ
jgi:hypothetical protein